MVATYPSMLAVVAVSEVMDRWYTVEFARLYLSPATAPKNPLNPLLRGEGQPGFLSSRSTVVVLEDTRTKYLT